MAMMHKRIVHHMWVLIEIVVELAIEMMLHILRRNGVCMWYLRVPHKTSVAVILMTFLFGASTTSL
jgi:hypothetical protein